MAISNFCTISCKSSIHLFWYPLEFWPSVFPCILERESTINNSYHCSVLSYISFSKSCRSIQFGSLNVSNVFIFSLTYAFISASSLSVKGAKSDKFCLDFPCIRSHLFFRTVSAGNSRFIYNHFLHLLVFLAIISMANVVFHELVSATSVTSSQLRKHSNSSNALSA